MHIRKAFASRSGSAVRRRAAHPTSFPKPAGGSPGRSSKPPSHTPQGFDNPTPRRAPKEGRSFPKRPAFRISGQRSFTGSCDDRLDRRKKLNKNLALERQCWRILPCECSLRYPKSVYLDKRNVTKSVTESAEICIFASYTRKKPC